MPQADSLKFDYYIVLQRENGTPWELDRDASSVTYKAEDARDGNFVALRVIEATNLIGPIAREEFLRAGMIAARSPHDPNLASILHCGQTATASFYATEYPVGESLQDLVSTRDPLQPWVALGLILQVTNGLVFMHSRGLRHLNLHPRNVIVVPGSRISQSQNGGSEAGGLGNIPRVKITGFNFVQTFCKASEVTVAQSGSGLQPAGELEYMSPEQIAGRSELLGSASDIYSLGTLLWYLLTKQPPTSADSLRRSGGRREVTRALGQLDPTRISGPLRARLEWMLSDDPRQRPPSHSKLMVALAVPSLCSSKVDISHNERSPSDLAVQGGKTVIPSNLASVDQAHPAEPPAVQTPAELVDSVLAKQTSVFTGSPHSQDSLPEVTVKASKTGNAKKRERETNKLTVLTLGLVIAFVLGSIWVPSFHRSIPATTILPTDDRSNDPNLNPQISLSPNLQPTPTLPPLNVSTTPVVLKQPEEKVALINTPTPTLTTDDTPALNALLRVSPAPTPSQTSAMDSVVTPTFFPTATAVMPKASPAFTPPITPPPAPPSRDGLTWEKKTIELKADTRTTVLETKFHFTNAGKTAVDIRQIESSCGCITTELEQRHYEPGASGDIIARYTVGSHVGFQTQSIAVDASDPDQSTILTLAIQIPEFLRIAPPYVSWKHGEAAKAKQITLKLLQDTPIKDIAVHSSQSAFNVTMQTLVKGREYRLDITPTRTDETIFATLTIHCQYGDEDKTFRAYATVKMAEAADSEVRGWDTDGDTPRPERPALLPLEPPIPPIPPPASPITEAVIPGYDLGSMPTSPSLAVSPAATVVTPSPTIRPVDQARAYLVTARKLANTIKDDSSKHAMLSDLMLTQGLAGDFEKLPSVAEVRAWGDDRFLVNLAQARASAGKVDAAMTTLKTIQATTHAIRALGAIAVVQAKTGHNREARATFEQALAGAGAGAKLKALGRAMDLMSLACFQIEAGYKDDARATSLQAMTLLQPLEYDWVKDFTLHGIAVNQAASGDLDSTYATVNMISESYTRAESIADIAVVVFKAGNAAEARKIFQQAHNVVDAIKYKDKKDKQWENFEKKLALCGIAMAYAEIDDLRNARQTLAEMEAIERSPDDEDKVLSEIAASQARQGDVAGAKATLKEIKGDQQGKKTSALRAITAAIAKKETFDAAEQWIKTLAAPSEQVECYDALAQVCLSTAK